MQADISSFQCSIAVHKVVSTVQIAHFPPSFICQSLGTHSEAKSGFISSSSSFMAMMLGTRALKTDGLKTRERKKIKVCKPLQEDKQSRIQRDGAQTTLWLRTVPAYLT